VFSRDSVDVKRLEKDELKQMLVVLVL